MRPKQLLYKVAKLSGLPALLRRFDSGAVILCYHNVISHQSLPHGGHLFDHGVHMDASRFERQMRWVRDNLEVVPVLEILTRIGKGVDVKGLAALTFDDGYRGYFHRALPILRHLGLPSTVFLVSQACEDGTPYWWDHPQIVKTATPQRRRSWLVEAQGDGPTILKREGLGPAAGLHEDLIAATWDLVNQHSGGDVTFGAHTLQHRCLTTLTERALRQELEEGFSSIANRVSHAVPWLAYPYGAWDERVASAAQAAGYTACLSLDRGRVSQRNYTPLAIPRIGIPGSISDDAFEAWLSGLYPPR